MAVWQWVLLFLGAMAWLAIGGLVLGYAATRDSDYKSNRAIAWVVILGWPVVLGLVGGATLAHGSKPVEPN